jgi:hypothetical protein
MAISPVYIRWHAPALPEYADFRAHQVNFAPLQLLSMVLSIETKKSGNDSDRSQLQIGVLLAAQCAFLRAAAVSFLAAGEALAEAQTRSFYLPNQPTATTATREMSLRWRGRSRDAADPPAGRTGRRGLTTAWLPSHHHHPKRP